MQDTVTHPTTCTLAQAASLKNSLGALDIRRDSEYWFDDGSIVIVARDTAYKVHKSILARHSRVFSDLFSAPQTTADDYVECTPAVHVQDAPSDFSNLLKALYDTPQDSTLFQHDQRLSFAVVAGLYELAHKYQIDNLAEEMLRRLKSCFTHNLQTWDALDHVSVGEGQRFTIIRSPSLKVCAAIDAIRAVNLARRANIPSLLPVAVYIASFHHAQALLDGIARHDGTVDTLSREDLELCLDARVIFAHWTYTKLAWFMSGRVVPDCKSPAACAAGLIALTASIKGRFSKPRAAYFALDPFASVMKDMTKQNGVCKKCGTAMRAKAAEERLAMWRALPRDLGLDEGGWGDA
ncbi:hypothetical protein C8Q79DRAFT_424060 [Trametes meyenii]|nr:hypothetical protein C8Q79DRAFT_424060 [Trametes meyenii]